MIPEDFHPNMKPIVPTKLDDIRQLGRDMMVAAFKYPCGIEQEYSNNEVEMVERCRAVDFADGKFMVASGMSRSLMLEPTSVISLCVSLEVFEPDKPCYRLSIARITGPMMYAPIPNDWADMIALAFFGEKRQAVPNPSGIEHAKHYVMYVEPNIAEGAVAAAKKPAE